MPELVVEAAPNTCLVCRRSSALDCPCGRSYCADLVDLLRSVGVVDCDCGVPWSMAA